MTNREIDAQVTEHITGGWYTSNRMEYRWLCCKEFAEGMGLIPAYMSFEIGTEGTGQIPHYTTDPAASKQLRDKMRDDGFNSQVNSYPAGYVAGFRVSDQWLYTEAKSEEMAVALAALAANGKPVRP